MLPILLLPLSTSFRSDERAVESRKRRNYNIFYGCIGLNVISMYRPASIQHYEFANWVFFEVAKLS